MSSRTYSCKLKVDNDHSKLYRKMMIPVTKSLSIEEKKYLLSVERGDMANVRRIIQTAHKSKTLDVNCVDNLGRGAIMLAIDSENLEMLELLVIMGVETKGALLYAINIEFVEAVEFLLEHEELIHVDGDLYSWEKVDVHQSHFTPDITPLILAAHKNNYEILKILLDRGATLPMPHDIKCGCAECITKSKEDSLRHSLARVNIYRALASPSLIALSSPDPILSAFQLSWDMRNLAFAEPEYQSQYKELRFQCQQFAVDLLQQSRSSQELSIILNQDSDCIVHEDDDQPVKLARLLIAIKYKQKKFVAHPHIQQMLAAIWYEGVPGFRRRSILQKCFVILKLVLFFPFYCLLYIIYPNCQTGKLMRKPLMKFLIHAASYLTFLAILMSITLMPQNLKISQFVILAYVLGFIFEELREIYFLGLNGYLSNLWNFIDFSRNLLYTLVFIMRLVICLCQLNRKHDLYAISDGLFATANIFSVLKLIHLFSVNPNLGPLQISLGRMVNDIVKFFFIYTVVVFAFASGLEQMLWRYSGLEYEKCNNATNVGENDGGSCKKWRGFYNLFEASQSLFWASFGKIEIDSFQLTNIPSFTRFWALLMFGCYSVINIIVLLTLLIAMMSNSYAAIHDHSDTEWKFARTKLWMSYFEGSTTLPAPFNIIPTLKQLKKWCRCRKRNALKSNSFYGRHKDAKDRDYRYSTVMRALVWRYVSAMHRKCEENAVTEDHINEVKSEVSTFRYELLDILNKNGMDVSDVQNKDKTAVLGKKMKVWERRLMKDFKVVPIAMDSNAVFYEPPAQNETTVARFKRIAKLALINSNLNKWRQTVKAARLQSQIGKSTNRDSYKKRENLKKAMAVAKSMVSSNDLSDSESNVNLPDTTGSKILNILQENKNKPPSPMASSMSMLPKVIILNRSNFTPVTSTSSSLNPSCEPGNTQKVSPITSYVYKKKFRVRIPKESRKDDLSPSPDETIDTKF